MMVGLVVVEIIVKGEVVNKMTQDKPEKTVKGEEAPTASLLRRQKGISVLTAAIGLISCLFTIAIGENNSRKSYRKGFKDGTEGSRVVDFGLYDVDQDGTNDVSFLQGNGDVKTFVYRGERSVADLTWGQLVPDQREYLPLGEARSNDVARLEGQSVGNKSGSAIKYEKARGRAEELFSH